MKDKICIVTGASSGIGKETAKTLSKMGAHVVIVCRNEERGQNAKTEIEELTGNQVDLYIADLSSLRQIKNLANKISRSFPHIDVLINNAGNFYQYRQLSAEGIEMTFALNFLAQYYLTTLLLNKIKTAPQGRIINVTSRNQSMGRIDFEQYDFKDNNYSGLKAYANAKLMLIIFTKALAKRLSGTRVTVNCVHPGDVATNIGMRDNNWLYKLVWRTISLLNTSIEKGAETSLYLATAPELADVSSLYFVKKKKANYNKEADLPGIGEKLWDFADEIIKEHSGIHPSLTISFNDRWN